MDLCINLFMAPLLDISRRYDHASISVWTSVSTKEERRKERERARHRPDNGLERGEINLLYTIPSLENAPDQFASNRLVSHLAMP